MISDADNHDDINPHEHDQSSIDFLFSKIT